MSFLAVMTIFFNLLYVIPKNDNDVCAAGVDNIVERANYLYNSTWVAQRNVSGWNYTFIKGKTYRIPYGQPVTSGKYICFGVSVNDYLAAAANASSVFYTTQSYYTGTKTRSTYYATDCSCFVSYCWGVPRTTTSNWASLDATSMGKVNSFNFSKIQKGDALNRAGSHIVLVTAVNSDGTIEITEQTPLQLKKTKYTKEQLISKYSAYTIYRYNKRNSIPAAPNSTVKVKFHRNLNNSDTESVTETFTSGVSNQKFGYKPDGTERYSTMNNASIGFGKWSNSGYKMLGWSTDKNATTASWKTYSSVVDSWIAKNAPSVNLYAVWEQSLSSIEIDTQPTYKIYPRNGKIDAEGLVLKVIFSDGSTQKVTEGFTVKADLSSTVKTTATVSYGGKTATYDIEVKNYFDGDGTEASPYLIKSKDDLKMLADVVNTVEIYYSYKQAHYKQTADIDFGNEVFTPIGTYQLGDGLFHYISFDGVYDGNKHKITNLNVNWQGAYAGLFGRTQRHSVIKDLSVYGNITGNGACAGGIVGEVGYGGKVLNCSFNGTVTGTQYAGGIAGRIHVGHASNSENAEMSDCYFAGSVSGNVTGGIVGKTVIETTKNNTVTYSNNYFLKSEGLSASGDESISSNNGHALSEELMKSVSEMPGVPFVSNWSNNLNDGYPVFEWQVILRGDANNDGEVNISDALMLQK